MPWICGEKKCYILRLLEYSTLHCIYCFKNIALASSQSVQFLGNITIDSVSSQPEVYNTSFRDVISVKISQEAVITYSFLANATVIDGSPFNHIMSLTISAGSHLLVSLNLVTWECFWNSLDCALLL